MPSFEDSKLLPKQYVYNPEGYIWYVLPVERFSELPEEVKVNGQDLYKKSEFHVTVINAHKVAQKIRDTSSKTIQDSERQLQFLLKQYVEETPLTFNKFEDDLRLASTSDRMSIAARCKINNIEGYFKSIIDMYQIDIPLQPTHVSIYTQTGLAVGIDTNEQMNSYEKLNLSKIQTLLKHIDLN